MMFINNIIVLFFIILICIIIHETYSFEIDREETADDTIMETHIVQPSPSFDYQNLPIDLDISTLLHNRRSESAKNYLNWIRKTQHPVEYLRSKRFWLFAKNDEAGMRAELIPSTNAHQNSLTQGLWRSGIVGRRR